MSRQNNKFGKVLVLFLVLMRVFFVGRWRFLPVWAEEGALVSTGKQHIGFSRAGKILSNRLLIPAPM